MYTWNPDPLGEGFENLKIELADDAEGEVWATLVRATVKPVGFWQKLFKDPKPLEGVSVLYVHGWSDYFFQKELADYWRERGANFFALDLRKYGRSLGEHQTPGYIEDLATYDEEIGQALQIIRLANPRFLFLMGHSTGGLTLSLYADRHPDSFDALILNSPWLELQLSEHGRKFMAPLVELSAALLPHEAAPSIDFGYYTRAQKEVSPEGSPIEINKDWRPENSFPVRAGWLKAIISGHNTVSLGLGIDKPVGVLLSARSALPTRWSEELKEVDSVLTVNDIAKAALKISSNMTIRRIDGALHDVFLSATAPRRDAYMALDEFVHATLAIQKH